MTTTAPRLSDRRAYGYIAAFSAVFNAVLLVAPVIATKLGEQFSLDALQVGAVFSVELGCFSLATIPAFLWLRNTDLRVVSLICLGIVILGNAVTAMIDSYALLVVIRGLTALGAGSVMVIVLSISAKTANPSRAYGVFVASQLAMGALILAIFPALFSAQPVSAIYWTLVVLCVLIIPAAWLLRGDELRRGRSSAETAGEPRPEAPAATGSLQIGPLLGGMAALLTFYIGLSGVWTYMADVAVAGGTTLDEASTMLSLATLVGVVSALLTTIVGEHRLYRWFVLIGYGLMISSILLLLGGVPAFVFAISAMMFKFAWSWLLPFLMSAVSKVGGPQGMNAANLMIGTGLAIGPLVAGGLIDGSGGQFTSMLIVSVCVLVVSIIASVYVMWAPKRRAAAAPATA
ncbi:MFS transporter [Gulosibacter sp. 10]|uniref:MFS transporter n=1 Tax=Gulosibacter sp. 10 TaxID=1255570 RepID=UPI00097F5B10|nr:MFS transporter [Gulosibacter sp. 10]SJM65167.1 Permeases of the major facilitator superfamily [Gulosibacter sp. 10]